MEVDIACLDDLEDHRPTVVRVGTRELLAVRMGTRVHVLRNVCPHMSESFEGARLCTRVVGARRFGDLDRVEEPAITCPWHGWQFKLSTGECLVDPKLRVKSYETRVEAGRVLVDL